MTKRVSFEQLAGKTIAKVEMFLSHFPGESDLVTLTFTDETSFVLEVSTSRPTFSYSTASSQEADLQPGQPIDRSEG